MALVKIRMGKNARIGKSYKVRHYMGLRTGLMVYPYYHRNIQIRLGLKKIIDHGGI